MAWWLWLAGGLALVVAELATPSGFFIIFFGLGALTVGVLTAVNVVTSDAAQWLLFSVLSVVYLAVFRGRLQSRMQVPPPPNVDSLVGELRSGDVRRPEQYRLSGGLEDGSQPAGP